MSTPGEGHEGETDDLDDLRRQIEAADRDLIRLIALRVKLARRVGVVKRAAGLPAVDANREAEVFRRAGEVARQEGAAEDDVRYVFRFLIDMSRRAQATDD